MDLLDWIIIFLTVASAIHGLRLGAAVQLFSFGGLLGGLIIGIALVSAVAPHTHGHMRTFLALVLLLVPCALLWAVGRQIGGRLWGRMQGHTVAHLDSAAGAAIAMAGTLVFVWVLAAILVNSPIPTISDQIQSSAIIRGVSGVMPQVPTELASLEHLLNQDGFPLADINLEGPEVPVKMPSSLEVKAAVDVAGDSTVQVVAYGCDDGDIVENGSGFVAKGDLVVTNAHVVAGSSRIEVHDQVQSFTASVVLFDPEFDIAVLRVPGLTDPALRLDPHFVGRGTKAVVLGFPGGGPFDAQPAGVLQRLDAVGTDIYDEHETTRWVYELEALVRPGNSGGPLVEPNGLVIGVVFSRSAANDHIGFALNSPGVLVRLHEAEHVPARTVDSTGRCING